VTLTERDWRSIDDFRAARGADWDALRDRIDWWRRTKPKRRDPAEVRRFAALYRAVGADLSVARLRFPRNPVTAELNRLVGQAHALLYETERHVGRRVVALLAAGFPQAVRRNGRFVAAAAATLVGAMALGWLWAALDPDGATRAFPGITGGGNPAETPLVSTGEGIALFGTIAVNNLRVALLAFALGPTLVGTVVLLALNGLLIGALFGLQAAEGRLATVMALVTPHGVVELTVIVLAAAAGMRIGWAVVSPGRLPRTVALRRAGREAMRILVGTVPFFVLAGVVEGLVTPAGLPIAANIVIGWVLGVGFWVYLVLAGRTGRDRARAPEVTVSAAPTP
jgi:uncharacterized membrane protein SpoIIM required for sporulation